jgi:hypothetical protein
MFVNQLNVSEGYHFFVVKRLVQVNLVPAAAQRAGILQFSGPLPRPDLDGEFAVARLTR